MAAATDRLIALGVGEIIVTNEPSVITTVLGSCVSVCIFSVLGRCGGMNHFVMPRQLTHSPCAEADEIYRYGEAAIATLIDMLLSLPGVSREELRAKIVGGACLKGHGVINAEVGEQNVALAQRVLARLGIPVIGNEVGGAAGRKIFFYADTGRLRVQKIVLAKQEPLLTSAPPPSPPGVVRKKSVACHSGAGQRIRTLIVDDSRTIQMILKKILSSDAEIEVVGTADNPKEAEKVLSQQTVDVMTLDIHMPIMDGVTFLGELMNKKPLPVVMVTALNIEDGDHVLKALELGAVDYVQKPKLNELDEIGPVICTKVKAAASAKVQRHKFPISQKLPPVRKKLSASAHHILAIGASTGGTEAIKKLLMSLPAMMPAIVIVQHIPALFSAAFASRLNDLCALEVHEAVSDDMLQPGSVLVAPGGKQMYVECDGLGYRVKVTDDPPLNRYKPSVDILFQSVARCAGEKATGVLLTGMGHDGAEGLLQMRKAGAFTLAQDEASCVVFGMPKAAVELKAATEVLALEQMGPRLLQHFEKKKLI
jgi:two-component system chemotaxis response regulator CheB